VIDDLINFEEKENKPVEKEMPVPVQQKAGFLPQPYSAIAERQLLYQQMQTNQAVMMQQQQQQQNPGMFGNNQMFFSNAAQGFNYHHMA
jgi:hypothetical protein